MDVNVWMVRTGIGSDTQKFADGKKHTFHFKLRTPPEVAFHLGEIQATGVDGEGAVKRQELQAKFLAESICSEDGTLLLDEAKALLIAPALKNQLCSIVIAKSVETVSQLGKT